MERWADVTTQHAPPQAHAWDSSIATPNGREVRYRLADPDVTVACGIMRGVLERRLARMGAIAARSARPRPGHS